MRLKEIKPGMVIHCKTEEEANALMVELDRLGYRWINTRCVGDNRYSFYRGATCYCISNCQTITYADLDYWKENNREITEFSDLVIPELSAKEVLETLHDMCSFYNSEGRQCSNCPADPYCVSMSFKDGMDSFLDACTKWREENPKEEKKELETEWVYVVRIIKVHDNGKKECVHEVDLTKDEQTGEYPLLEDFVTEQLKKYCSEHKGNFFAVYERICRIKE